MATLTAYYWNDYFGHVAIGYDPDGIPNNGDEITIGLSGDGAKNPGDNSAGANGGEDGHIRDDSKKGPPDSSKTYELDPAQNARAGDVFGSNPAGKDMPYDIDAIPNDNCFFWADEQIGYILGDGTRLSDAVSPDDLDDSIGGRHYLSGKLEPWPMYTWLAKMYFDDARQSTSPLVIDLNGDGVTLVSMDASSAYFDFDADGFREKTGWISSSDGLLVYDQDGDGLIENTSELFGNATTDGFAVLAQFDTNADGAINASDTVFSSLEVWIDDGDGVSEDGELHSLSDLGIASISLDAAQVQYELAGNTVSHESTVVWADGHSTDVIDAWFTISQMYTVSTNAFAGWEYDEAELAQVSGLPELSGYGIVKDLSFSMLTDDTLRQMVQDFDNMTVAEVADYAAAVEAIIYRWTGVEGTMAGSRGNTDATKLEAMENLFGEEWIGENGYDYVCGDDAAADLQQAWDILFDAIYLRMVVQGPLQSLFPSVTYNWYSDSLETTEAVSTLFSEVGAAAQGTRSEVVTYWQALVPICDLLAGETAPVAGVVQQLAVHTVGGVVTPAQPVLVIVPRDAETAVEAWLANKDAGFVREGQPVELKVDTFPFTRYGTLRGRVAHVSRDAVPVQDAARLGAPTGDGTGAPLYRVRMALEETSLLVDGRSETLTPGMAVVAEIKTGRRPIIDYLLSPLRRYGKEGLRER